MPTRPQRSAASVMRTFVSVTSMPSYGSAPALQDVPMGAGSGLVYDAVGHVVTNYHVITGAREVTVTFTGEDARVHPMDMAGDDVVVSDVTDVAFPRFDVEVEDVITPRLDV